MLTDIPAGNRRDSKE